MADCDEILQDECIEVLVKTEVNSEPRGKQQEEMSTFEKLVHTAISLENDPLLNEHDYAYSNNCCVRIDHSYSSASGKDRPNDGKSISEEDLVKHTKRKDHSYFSYRQLAQCKDQCVSNEDLTHLDFLKGKPHLLSQYRSNDSALDVTGFDTISDKCLSYESVHLKTVEVFTEQRMFSGISDPDISKMTIDSNCENLSTSLPTSPSSLDNVFDHTYNKRDEADSLQHDVMSLSKDHTYDSCDKSHERRDSLPATVGIKRGHSNEDLNLTNLLYFKKKDFQNSPFLDQSYQSLETRKTCTRHGSLKHRKREKSCETDIDNVFKLTQQRGVKSYATYSESSQLLQDHTYEEIGDTATCFKVSDLVKKVYGAKTTEDTRRDTSDHSYVMPKEDDNEDVCGSSVLSDSGTESLNEEEEAEMSSTFERLMTGMATSKDHAYVK